MKILDYNGYLDGGTILIATNYESYNIIGSTALENNTTGNYNSTIGYDALKEYNNIFYKESIENLIKNILLKI